MPSAVRLQPVSPTKTLPARPGWYIEPKTDGCRVLLEKDGDTVPVRLRGGGLVQRALPEVVGSMRRAEHVLFDGELVVLDESGQADFDATCARLRIEPSGRGQAGASSRAEPGVRDKRGGAVGREPPVLAHGMHDDSSASMGEVRDARVRSASSRLRAWVPDPRARLSRLRFTGDVHGLLLAFRRQATGPSN